MPAHLIIARDPLIAAEAASALLPEGISAERYYATDLDMDEIFNQLSTRDLFVSQRALHYIDVMELKQGKRDIERLSAMLKSLDEATTLVCTQVIVAETRSEEDRRVKSAALKPWIENTKVHDLRRQSDGAQALGWIGQRARERYGLALTRAQCERLYQVNGEHMALVDSELRKLSMLKGSEQLQPVPDNVIEQLVAGSPQAKFYELADAITRAGPDVIARLHEWFAIEPETHRLLGEMRRRFLGLRMLTQGMSVQPPFFERQLRAFERSWNGRRLERAIVLTAQLELKLKSGETVGESSKDAELAALEMYCADLQDALQMKQG
jgi:DNA polymerase III delta subunit